MGSSDDMEVGDPVVAIGNALGYGQSVTSGIISAKNRDVQTKEGVSKGLIQTDAAINPGNSGGALLNMQGELIGINVAKYADTDVEGMGYSIPSSAAEGILSSLSNLTTRDKVPEGEQGVLGVQVKDIDAQTAESFAMPKGIYIFKVLEDTGAENSAIQERDIITKLDGQGVYTTADLKSLLSKYRAGEEVRLTLMRQDGSGKYNEMEVKVVLGKASALSGNTGIPETTEIPEMRPLRTAVRVIKIHLKKRSLLPKTEMAVQGKRILLRVSRISSTNIRDRKRDIKRDIRKDIRKAAMTGKSVHGSFSLS